MIQRAWRGLVAVALACACLHAGAQAEDPPVLRLAALVMQALPVDTSLQRSLNRDPRWPLMDNAGRVQPAELQCIRERMAPDVYRKARLEQARAFASRRPEKMAESLRVLEDGAAEMFALLVAASRPQGQQGADLSTLGKDFSRAQVAALAELLADARHKELRGLMGIPENFGRERASTPNRPPMQEAAYALLVAALDHCKVPVTAIQ